MKNIFIEKHSHKECYLQQSLFGVKCFATSIHLDEIETRWQLGRGNLSLEIINVEVKLKVCMCLRIHQCFPCCNGYNIRNIRLYSRHSACNFVEGEQSIRWNSLSNRYLIYDSQMDHRQSRTRRNLNREGKARRSTTKYCARRANVGAKHRYDTRG